MVVDNLCKRKITEKNEQTRLMSHLGNLAPVKAGPHSPKPHKRKNTKSTHPKITKRALILTQSFPHGKTL